ncbi:MAG: hypothetical protein ACI9R3_006115 [Verrucomicrobiales bacterium]|jgi:hypothetical protein
MKKSYIVTIFILALTAAAIIGVQFSENRKLQRELTSLRPSLLMIEGSSQTTGIPATEALDNTAAESSSDDDVANSFTNLREILAQRNPMKRMQALLNYVKNLPVDQIGAALLELRAGAPDWDPEAKFVAHMLLTRWGLEDPTAAFTSVEALGVKRGGGDATSILASLAAVDPKRAIEWLNNPENTLQQMPKMGHILAGTIAKEWVRQDPSAAMEWAKNLPDDQRRGALGGVLESLASTDPGKAAELVMSLDNSRERGDLVGDIAESWGRQTPDSALDWAQTLQGDERARAIEEVLDGWAQTSPADAAAYIDGLPLDARTDRQIAQVAREWGRRNPSDAAAWLGSQEESAGKRDSIGEVMWNWTTTDPEAASTWLSEQPAGQSYDAGAGALAKAAFESDPAAAITWAATIGDDRQRGEMINGGLEWWTERDPAAAQEWAKDNGITLPEATRSEDSK